MATKVFPATKDTVRARHGDRPVARDGGGELHLLAGLQDEFTYTSYVKFGEDWAGVAKIREANLVLTTERDAHPGWPRQDSGIKVSRLASEFPDPNNAEPEGSFVGQYPIESKDPDSAANGKVSSGDAAVTRVNITGLVEDMAPRRVKRRNGRAGGDKPHHGFAIERRPTTEQQHPMMCVGSKRHPDTSFRPYIELIYDPTKAENTVDTVAPAGAVNDILSSAFEGTFSIGANQPADVRPSAWRIELYKEGGDNPVWSYEGAASPSDVLMMTCTVPTSLVAETGSRYRFVSGQDYEWRLRGKDNKGDWTDWSKRRGFTVQTLPPTLSDLRPSTTPALDTLNNVYFTAVYSDPEGGLPWKHQVQLRTLTAPSDPAWGEDILWDSGPVDGTGYGTPTPGQAVEVKQPYTGVGLEPGVYSWRMRAWDELAAESDWAYSEVTLLKGWEPDPGDVDLLTGYANRRLKARILIKGLANRVQKLVLTGSPDGGRFRLTYEGEQTAAIPYDASAADVRDALLALPNIGAGEVTVSKGKDEWTVTFDDNGRNRSLLRAGGYANFGAGERVDVFSDRAPGYPVAIIEDASNVGASEMYNDGGEFYFSLPAVHPQVSVIEPYQVHYSLEVFRGESWREIAAGYITDFDATDTDVVFYGQDYMAILGRQVDERFNQRKVSDAEAVLWPDRGGGSKYVNRSIKEIIQDQLDRSIHDTGSPLAFFTRAGLPPMPDNISIFVSFKERLPFIAGLIDSHRQGTNKRTRLYARNTGPGKYQWVVKDAPGKDRPNLRMEYGGLVQGFRVVPFGDFATRLNAIGRLYNSSRMVYSVKHAPTPEGEDAGWYEETYGRFAKATIYEDITDEDDLRRRAAQAANRISRVGKQLALNLRPGSFGIKDGWDICDNILVDIRRGVVQTTRMGSGYWTIWGWSWELRPNGQERVTLSVLPKEDKSAPEADLIPTEPILSERGDWQIEPRDPDAELDIDVFTHVNSNTGHIFQRSPETGLWVDRTNELPFSPTVLIDASLTPSRFLPSYRPVYVGESLPTLPDEDYPPGSLANDPRTDKLLQVSLDGLTWVEFAAGPPGPEGPPGSGGDGIAPPQVTGLSLGTAHTLAPDGTLVTVISATWNELAGSFGPEFSPEFSTVAVTDLLGYEVQLTLASAPWSTSFIRKVGPDVGTVVYEGVLAGADYKCRVRAYDTEGLVGEWSAEAAITSARDDIPPAVPAALDTAPGFKMVGLTWVPNTEPDLSAYDIEMSVPADPDEPAITFHSLTSRLVVGSLDPTKTYAFRVRAVDRSGNASAWTDPVTETPTLVVPDDLAVDALVANFISTGQLDAGAIKTGTLSVGGTNHPTSIFVYDSGNHLIGTVGEQGVVMTDPNEPRNAVILQSGQLLFTREYTGDPATTTWQTAVTPRGINAEAIFFEEMGGGNNRIPNASVELVSFDTGANRQSKVWTNPAEWATATSTINVDLTGADLRMASI
jgi:hypothetical protein